MSGRDVDAVDQATHYAESAPIKERQQAFGLASWVCIAIQDPDCARDILGLSDRLIKSLPATEVDRSTYGRSLLLWSFLQTWSFDSNSIQKAVGSAFPDGVTSSVADPVLFADLHILAARQAINANNYEAARDHVDKALASTLSLQYVRLDAPRLIVQIAWLLIDSYDVERAARLLATAEPLLRLIPEDSLLFCDYLIVRAELSGILGDFDNDTKDLKVVLSKLDKLQSKPAQKANIKAQAFNELLALEALRGNRDEVRRLLDSHPIAATRAAIVKRGYFADRNEFIFGVVDEFARLILGDQSETGWDDLLLAPPRWTGDSERMHEVWAFGQAAVGFHLLRRGKKEEARHQILEAGKKRLGYLQDRYRQSQFASPLPYWSDRILFEFSIAATTAAGETPDYDFVLGAYTILNRTLQTSADDALTSQAIQDSEERRRIAQTFRAMASQRSVWERKQLARLTERLSPSDKRDQAAINQERIDTLNTANDYLAQQRRMRAALLNAGPGAGVDSVATLAAVKDLLLPDEALIFHVGTLGKVFKVCVRADQIQSTTQAFDDASFTKDARLLQSALTATHPASIEADSQFPAAEAVRLYTTIFGGLEDCLRFSPRIYLVAANGLLATIPPAALLTELPKVMGSGFDLQSAHWMIRDHSFVRTSSMSAFVATKKLSKLKRASMDYLGVGDPVLAHRNANGLSGGEIAARGSLGVQSGSLRSLEELPETSEELEKVAALHDRPRARVLVRQEATEEAFRLQPLSEFDVLHFATHGLMREDLPGLPEASLVLTPSAGGDTFNDGLLTSSEIAALTLRARLVVLSSCNSARYDAQIIASGIQGLSTSFAMAGVPSMVASLWPIESSVTRDLVISLFELARGSEDVAIADALAIAMRRHLDGQTPRPLLHPRFWASLVLIGDGALKLNSSTRREDRDIGPYSKVNISDGGEILSAVPFTDDYVASAYGNWNGTRFASLIQRRTHDGSKQWEVEDHEIGAGKIAADKDIIYAGGYLSRSDGNEVLSSPVLRGIGPSGVVLWSHNLTIDTKSAEIAGLAVAPDQSAIALVGLSYDQHHGPRYSLTRIALTGTEIGHSGIDLEGADPSVRYSSGYVGISGATTLIALNRAAKPKSGQNAVTFNSLGLAELCWEGDAAELMFFNTDGLKEVKRIRLDRFNVAMALNINAEWLIVGDVRDGCGLERHAAVVFIRHDYSSWLVWRDNSPFQTFGRGARTIGVKYEIVGYAQRTIAIVERKSAEPKLSILTAPDPKAYVTRMRLGNEESVSGEVFSVHLSERGYEERRDFVAAGFPIAPQGMASSEFKNVIYGMVGQRPLWLPH